MLTLLRGGPRDGEVTQTSREQFGLAFCEAILKKSRNGKEKLLRVKEIHYRNSYEYIKHPAKKKGTIRVFDFCKTPPPWAKKPKTAKEINDRLGKTTRNRAPRKAATSR